MLPQGIGIKVILPWDKGGRSLFTAGPAVGIQFERERSGKRGRLNDQSRDLASGLADQGTRPELNGERPRVLVQVEC